MTTRLALGLALQRLTMAARPLLATRQRAPTYWQELQAAHDEAAIVLAKWQDAKPEPTTERVVVAPIVDQTDVFIPPATNLSPRL